jgi:hypothetical protein
MLNRSFYCKPIRIFFQKIIVIFIIYAKLYKNLGFNWSRKKEEKGNNFFQKILLKKLLNKFLIYLSVLVILFLI